MNIENVIIPEGVTSIREQAFYNCKNLQNIKAPKTLKEVKSLAVAGTKWFKTQHGFLILGDVLVHYIDSQPNAVIPDGIKHIGFGAFSSSKITSVKIPESVESIDDFSFSRCENLSEIFIPGSVKSIGSNAFLGCYNLKKVVIEEGTTSLGNGIFNLCHSLESIKIPSTLTKATKKSFMGEPNGRFNIPSIIGDIILISYNASEEEVNLPEGIKTISGNAIENNLYLTNLIMPDSVTNVEQYAISDCNSLAAVIFGLVKEIKSHTIHNCPSLNIVFIPDTVTKIEPGAFYGSPLLNIVGYKGSYAEAYAEKNRVPFYTIEEFLEILNGTQTSPSL